MNIINVKNVDGKTILPIQGSKLAAGYDIISISDPKIVGDKLENRFLDPGAQSNEWWRFVAYIEYETGLYIAPLDNSIHTLIFPRSSISLKTNLMLANSVGLVDCDYRGQILCRFRYIWQPFDMAWLHVKDHSDPNNPYVPMTLGNINPDRIYKKGDTIAQLVFSPTVEVNFQLVDELSETIRGEGGFGSTDQPKPQPTKPTYTEGVFGTIAEAYKQAGGIPIKKRYTDEIKERERMVTRKPSSTPIPQTGIHERKP